MPEGTDPSTAPAPAQTLTRQELYELVWSEPMRTLAKRYGISDVALAKTCRKHRIPRPWRGYWQRKRHGKSVRRTPLKALKPEEKDKLGTVTLAPRRRRKPAKEETGLAADQKRYEKEHPIEVPEFILRLHPLVREIQEHCRDSEGTRSSRWGRRQAKGAAVDVGPDSLPRALRILDTLIRSLEERGFPVAVDGEDDELRIFVTTNGTRLGVRLEERRKQVEIPLSASDRALFGLYSWRTEPRKELQYTGELALKIVESWADGVRKTWADGKKQRVEKCLNAFVVGLVRAAETKKRAKAEWEEKERRREEERLRWLEEEARRREEARRGERLEREAAAWAKAEQVRAYMRAVRERAERDGEIQAESELARWLVWAEDYAERMDPAGARGAARRETPDLPHG